MAVICIIKDWRRTNFLSGLRHGSIIIQAGIIVYGMRQSSSNDGKTSTF